MSTERMTFKGGWWADVRTEWPYGADTRIAGAWLALGPAPEGEDWEKACRVTLQQSVTDAMVPDLEGNALPFGPDVWDACDGRIGRAILRRARKSWGAWQRASDPEASGQSSPD